MPRQRAKIVQDKGDARAKFLAALSETGNILRSCQISGYPRQTAYDAREREPAFRELWDRAAKMGADALEDEATRRAAEGIEKPVYQGGKLVGKIREYSDTLMIFLLKGLKPDKFRDNAHVEHSGTITLEQLVNSSLDKEKE